MLRMIWSGSEGRVTPIWAITRPLPPDTYPVARVPHATRSKDIDEDNEGGKWDAAA